MRHELRLWKCRFSMEEDLRQRAWNLQAFSMAMIEPFHSWLFWLNKTKSLYLVNDDNLFKIGERCFLPMASEVLAFVTFCR